MAADRNALTCDMAETYGILDMRALPARLLATLAAGLRDDSRIKMKISGTKVDRGTLLSAMTVDLLNFIAWSKTKDGQKNRNRPKSIVNILLEKTTGPQKDDVRVFRSPEEFRAEWARLTGGEANGN